MPISTNGNFIFAEPGDGRTVLSMDGGEFNLFGKYTAIKTTAVDTFNKINDFMIEKKVEDPKTFQLIVGIGVTVVLGCLAVGAVAVAAGLTGGLALTVMGAVAAGFTRAAIETGIYTATSFLTDTVTNSHKSNKDFMQGLAISGGFGFVTGAFSYLNPTISFTPSPSLALEGGGTIAAAMPIIVTNVADTVLVLNESLVVSTVLSAAIGAGGGERDKEGVQIDKGGEESLWKPTDNKNNLWIKGKLKIHYDKHGGDFGAKSSPEYSNMAKEFGQRTSDSIIQTIHDGFVYRYEPSTNTIFIGTLKGGRIKTFYKWDGRVSDEVINILKSLGLLQ